MVVEVIASDHQCENHTFANGGIKLRYFTFQQATFVGYPLSVLHYAQISFVERFA